jgi:hypothetical protein
MPIHPRDPIVKIATKGKTTQHGQGPGIWIHPSCVQPGSLSMLLLDADLGFGGDE